MRKNIRDTIQEMETPLTAERQFDNNVMKEKSSYMTSLEIDRELDVMLRMEETSSVFQRLLKAEQTTRQYRTEIEGKKK